MTNITPLYLVQLPGSIEGYTDLTILLIHLAQNRAAPPQAIYHRDPRGYTLRYTLTSEAELRAFREAEQAPARCGHDCDCSSIEAHDAALAAEATVHQREYTREKALQAASPAKLSPGELLCDGCGGLGRVDMATLPGEALPTRQCAECDGTGIVVCEHPDGFDPDEGHMCLACGYEGAEDVFADAYDRWKASRYDE